jgi:hypothetical protein
MLAQHPRFAAREVASISNLFLGHAGVTPAEPANPTAYNPTRVMFVAADGVKQGIDRAHRHARRTSARSGRTPVRALINEPLIAQRFRMISPLRKNGFTASEKWFHFAGGGLHGAPTAGRG